MTVGELVSLLFLHAACMRVAAARCLAARAHTRSQSRSRPAGAFRKIWIPFRTTDDEIVLTDAIASSSALALKVNGTIDSESGDLDLRGVISPAYGLTGALDNVPLLGTLLSGGEGEGIFAMTFTLSGASKDPDFSLNPLSLLTPGFLRNVFEGNSSKPSEGFTQRLERQDQ